MWWGRCWGKGEKQEQATAIDWSLRAARFTTAFGRAVWVCGGTVRPEAEALGYLEARARAGASARATAKARATAIDWSLRAARFTTAFGRAVWVCGRAVRPEAEALGYLEATARAGARPKAKARAKAKAKARARARARARATATTTATAIDWSLRATRFTAAFGRAVWVCGGAMRPKAKALGYLEATARAKAKAKAKARATAKATATARATAIDWSLRATRFTTAFGRAVWVCGGGCETQG